MKYFIKLIIAILICQFADFIGSVFTTPSIRTWYAALNKPPLQPPNWIFGPVWLTLYLIMGISLYLIWINKAKPKLKNPAITVFALQMALNAIWSVIFFGAHLTLLAFIEIIALWGSILATIILFNRISKAASWLLVPYILWVSFASYLNLAIWLVNR